MRGDLRGRQYTQALAGCNLLASAQETLLALIHGSLFRRDESCSCASKQLQRDLPRSSAFAFVTSNGGSYPSRVELWL